MGVSRVGIDTTHATYSKLQKQKPFDLTFLYSYISLVVLLLNNPKFNDYIEVNYPKEFREYKDTIQMFKMGAKFIH